MKMTFLALAFVTAVIVAPVHATTILNDGDAAFDWDSNSGNVAFTGSSMGNSLAINTSVDATGGTGGSAGLEIEIGQGTFTGTNYFAQIYIRNFDFAKAGITNGLMTVADLDKIRVTFDMDFPIDMSNNHIGLLTQGNNFEVVQLNQFQVGTGAYQPYIYEGTDAGLADKQSFVNSFNAAGNTDTTFAIRLDLHNANGPASFPDVAVIDNILVELVPEPTSMALVCLGLASICARRHRTEGL